MNLVFSLIVVSKCGFVSSKVFATIYLKAAADVLSQVCVKAAEPGNKNKRLNTSILIRSSTSAGKFNILVDAGKYVTDTLQALSPVVHTWCK